MSRIRSGLLRRPPQLSQTSGIDAIMLDVLVALAPAWGMAIFLYGLRVVVLTAVSVATCVLCEYWYERLMKRPITVRDLSACVTGVMLAMTLPVTAPYWAPVLGGAFAIIVVKQFYGGLGRNFLDPALAGRMLLNTFPMVMSNWSDALCRVSIFSTADAVTAATPMAYLHEGVLPPHRLSQLLLGQQAGSLGEVCSFLLLLGGLYLLLRRVISVRIPLSFLGTVALLSLLFPRGNDPLRWTLTQLLSGGLIFGAVFMATDYTSSPVTPKGHILFGTGCGVLTFLLRRFGSYPEGVGWAILTMNGCVWLLDRAGVPRRFGAEAFAPTRRRMERARKSLAQIKFVRPQWKLPRFVNADGSVAGENHLDQVRAWGRAWGTLAVLVLAVGFGLGKLSQMTSLDTARAELVQQRELLRQVMPAASYRSETPYSSPYALSITAGYSEDEMIGYCVEVQTNGFGGPITMVVGVDLDGKVTGVAITDHSETPNVGTSAMEGDYLSQYVGRSGTVRHSGANSIDAVAGATATSKAITTGVNRALAIVASLDPDSEVPYEDGEV